METKIQKDTHKMCEEIINRGVHLRRRDSKTKKENRKGFNIF